MLLADFVAGTLITSPICSVVKSPCEQKLNRQHLQASPLQSASHSKEWAQQISFPKSAFRYQDVLGWWCVDSLSVECCLSPMKFSCKIWLYLFWRWGEEGRHKGDSSFQHLSCNCSKNVREGKRCLQAVFVHLVIIHSLVGITKRKAGGVASCSRRMHFRWNVLFSAIEWTEIDSQHIPF